MPTIFGLDHKIVAIGTITVTAGIAAYSTIRLLNERKSRKDDQVYETERIANEYLAFHYGSPSEVLLYDFGPKNGLDFPKRCADLCMKYFEAKPGVPTTALDIGCAVGRASFELAKQFTDVLGVDYSYSFVNICNELQRHGELPYEVTDEGDLRTKLLATVDSSIDRSRLRFQQGDACDLPADLKPFGCVLASNLICRLHHPMNFISRLRSLVAPGGVLVITGPYTWLEQFTEKVNWLGGYYEESGKPVTTFAALQKLLCPDFHLQAHLDMPFLIRETARKNQWTVAQATVWQRNS